MTCVLITLSVANVIRNLLGGHGLNGLAQDRDRWQAVTNLVMNLWVLKMQEIC